MSDLDQYAALIRGAYAGGAIAPIRLTAPDATIDDAYAIQTINRDFWIAGGRQPVGIKVGLTTAAVQDQLGVDQPDFGILFKDKEVQASAVVPAGRLLQPKVEAEIAFVLGRDIIDLASPIAAAVSYALPALEIVDSRIADWDIKLVDTVADNASAGMFALGTKPVALETINLSGCSMRLEKNGLHASEGNGSACLGNPLNALEWLAATRLERGEPLRKGDIILSGALGPMIQAKSGDFFQAQIEGLGSIGVTFA